MTRCRAVFATASNYLWRHANTFFFIFYETLILLKLVNLKVHKKYLTAILREAFLFRVPNSFGIFLMTFAILKNPFANPLKSCKSPYGICNVPKLIKCF